MRKLVGFFVDNPVIINVMLITLMIMGVVVFFNLKKESYPDIAFNIMSISVTSDGTSLRDTELLITKPIEDELKEVSGIEKFESRSSAGSSTINVYLNVWGDDKYEVIQNIREAVSIASKKFPDNTDAAIIKEIKGIDEPLIRYQISSNTLSPIEMHDLVKSFQQILESVEGVAQVTLSGFRDREVQINFDTAKLVKQNLSLLTLTTAVSNYVVRESAGNLNGPDLNRNIQLLTDFEKIHDIQNINIRRSFNSKGVSIKDVAIVQDGLEDPTVYVRGNLEPGVTISVYKEDAQDNFRVLERIKQVVQVFESSIQLRYNRVPTDKANLLDFLQQSPVSLGYGTALSKLVMDNYGYNTDIQSFKDATVETRNLLQITAHDAYIGIILVFIMLWIFLDIRTAFWTAFSIPVVILMVFIVVFFMGYSINNMMLFGMITAIGLLVDYGIVTAENIYRLRSLGYTPRDASVEGVMQLSSALFATMLTKVCVFLPILLVKKIDFLYIKQMPIIIIITLMMALIEVFFSLPAHFARIKGFKDYEHLEKEPHLSFGDRFMLSLKEKYIRGLNIAIRWRYGVLFFFVFLIILALLLVDKVKFEYYSNDENDEINIRLEAVDGTNLDQMNEKVSAVEQMILKLMDSLGNPLVSMFTTVGSGALAPTDGSGKDANKATIRLYLTSFSERTVSSAEIVRKLEDEVKQKTEFSQWLTYKYIQQDPLVHRFLIHPDYHSFIKLYRIFQDFLNPNSSVQIGFDAWFKDYQRREVKVTNVNPYKIYRTEVKDFIRSQFGFTKFNVFEAIMGPRQDSPIQLLLTGNDDILREKALGDMYNFLSSIRGVFGLEETKNDQGQDFFLHLNVRKMEQLGITPTNVAQSVRTAFLGTQVGTIANANESISIKVIMNKDHRGFLKDLMGIPLPTNYGTVIPLNHVARLELHQDLSSVRRVNGKRTSYITASVNMKDIDVQQVSRLLDRYIPKLLAKYPGVGVEKQGDMGDLEDTAKQTLIIGMLGLVGVFFILLFIFRSLSQPIFVLSVLPFGIIGVIFAFILHQQPMTFFGFIGLIGLTGIIINDSIIMVDYINVLLREGKSRSFTEAVCAGAAERIRPILLTTITAVVGLLPSIYGWGGSVSVLRPLAMSIGYGLLFGTLITLFLVPCMYLVNEDLKKCIRNIRHLIINYVRKGFLWFIKKY